MIATEYLWSALELQTLICAEESVESYELPSSTSLDDTLMTDPEAELFLDTLTKSCAELAITEEACSYHHNSDGQEVSLEIIRYDDHIMSEDEFDEDVENQDPFMGKPVELQGDSSVPTFHKKDQSEFYKRSANANNSEKQNGFASFVPNDQTTGNKKLCWCCSPSLKESSRCIFHKEECNRHLPIGSNTVQLFVDSCPQTNYLQKSALSCTFNILREPTPLTELNNKMVRD